MDRFFASVACLMSNNLRSAVYSSLKDLVNFLETYKHGNDYDGEFVRSLPVLPQLLILSVVSIIHFIILFPYLFPHSDLTSPTPLLCVQNLARLYPQKVPLISRKKNFANNFGTRCLYGLIVPIHTH